MVPFILVLLNSFKQKRDIIKNPFSFITEKGYTLANYTKAFEKMEFIKAFGNSLFITGLSTLLVIIFASMVAYYFTRAKNTFSRVFFALMAAGNNKWSTGKQFTQRVAYSTDGGESLHKLDKGVLPTVCKENRDPKVFWHEKSNAYIMTLWLEESDFGIFRSTDLLNWEQTDRLTFKEAWECPDLVCLKDEKGNETWMFWSADGYYFWGDFDGFKFQTDGVRHAAYINKMAYAAQTYSNTGDRVISVPWLRLPNRGRNYTGAMGLPREFSVAYKNGEKVLRQEPVREYENSKKLVS